MTQEGVYRRRPKKKEVPVVHTVWPPGHFFSPVVDPSTVKEYVARNAKISPDQIPGIEFPLEAMREFWEANLPMLNRGVKPGDRYDPVRGYTPNDARTLRTVISAMKPKRIIEIGAGNSTCCMLDTLDELKSSAEITCIEPFAERLMNMVRPEDRTRIKLIEAAVQDVPASVFAELNPGDIVFIDSAHVLKTGSDVHYELFTVLPSLKPGVFVHFHDCRYPFEYPDPFIFEKNYSWNEAYAVRALLMYSTRFKIFFYNSLFARHYRDLVRRTCPDFMMNPGSSLWIRVQG